MMLRFPLLLALATSFSCSSSSQDAADGSVDGDANGRDGAPFECEVPSFVQATVLAEHGPGALGVTIADDVTYWANRNEGEIWQIAPPGEPVLVAGVQLRGNKRH